MDCIEWWICLVLGPSLESLQLWLGNSARRCRTPGIDAITLLVAVVPVEYVHNEDVEFARGSSMQSILATDMTL